MAKAVGMSLANVYVTRHRFSAALKSASKRLEQQWERKAADARRRAEADRRKREGEAGEL